MSAKGPDLHRLVAENLVESAVVLRDRAGRVTDWNPGAERLLGYTAGEAVGLPLDRVLPPEDRPAAAELARAEALGRVSGTRWLVRRDGSRVWADGVTAALRDAAGLHGFGVVLRDQTDRRRAEEAQARLAGLVERSDTAVVLTGRGSIVEGWNPAAGRLFGYAAAEVVGRPILDLVPPAQREAAARVVEAAWAGEHVAPYEAVRVRKGGGEVPVSVNPWPVRDAAGAVVGVAVVYTDLTDRRRAEEAARAGEEFVRTVIAAIPCGVFWKDRDSVYLGCNEFFARNGGLASPADIVGMTDYDFDTDPAEIEYFRACDRRVIETGEPLLNVEETLSRPDGRRFTLLTSKVPLRDAGGAVVGVLGVYQDVTELKRAEDAVRLSERHLRAVVDANPECVKLLAPNGTLLALNPAGLTFAEADHLDDLRGRPIFDLIAPEDLPAYRELHEAVCRGEPRVLEFGLVGLRGGRRRLSTHAVPLPGPNGETLHLGLTRDVTEHRKLEALLRQSQKMEAVGQLAGGVAHDFNNVLAVILGYGDLALRHLAAGHPAHEPVAEMLRAGERAARLTRQLLAFSRRQPLAPRVFDLNAVVREMESMLRRVIGEDIDLAVRLDPALGSVRADPSQVEQVVLNLAVNARDAMPTGGHLTIETTNVRLEDGYARDHPGVTAGGYVRLAVSDTGCGMTDDVKAHAFEPFFTTKPAGTGTGLGLATVYGVAKQSGGSVEIYTEPGVGTTFKVYLPRVEPADRPGPSPSGVRIVRPGTETILLVEDDPSVRALTRHVLRGGGYTVLEAEDGPAAVAQAAAHPGPIHLLMTDVVMPGLGGREVAERVSAGRPGVLVLYTSGYADDAVVRHGLVEENVHFLQKPFLPSLLLHKVREVLDGPEGAA